VTEAKVSKKRYVVEQSAEERKWLEKLIRKGKGPAKKQLKALLWADESPLGPRWGDPQIFESLGTYPMMCGRVRQQFAQSGMDAVLNRKQRATPPVPRIFDGEKEARLVLLYIDRWLKAPVQMEDGSVVPRSNLLTALQYRLRYLCCPLTVRSAVKVTEKPAAGSSGSTFPVTKRDGG
jgi:hypothetical protein